ncbi:hypothetical protein GUJ93_ZPchr0014g46783 [Zizania palustris]|uniref:Uncharacterized protein n=1 Tax=Zizania palustris TaxID=103762 RepID=A0A8J5W0G1_ZIZPA|nr:hypothetical protein GUJ93_ZPchr0014g46783 [Zizania palustris]
MHLQPESDAPTCRSPLEAHRVPAPAPAPPSPYVPQLPAARSRAVAAAVFVAVVKVRSEHYQRLYGIAPLDQLFSIDPTKYKMLRACASSVSMDFSKRKIWDCIPSNGTIYEAEVAAHVALCPMEAVNVRVQTRPGFVGGLYDGLSKFAKAGGYAGLYKGIIPHWG